MTKHRAAIIMGGGMLLVLLSVLLQSWWKYSRERQGRTWTWTYGLTKVTVYDQQESETEALDEAARAEEEKDWAAGGGITFGVAIIASVVVGAAVLVRLAKGSIPFPLMRLGTVSAVALFFFASRFAFLLKPDTFRRQELDMSWGLPVFFTSLVTVIVVGIMDWKGTAREGVATRRRRTPTPRRIRDRSPAEGPPSQNS